MLFHRITINANNATHETAWRLWRHLYKWAYKQTQPPREVLQAQLEKNGNMAWDEKEGLGFYAELFICGRLWGALWEEQDFDWQVKLTVSRWCPCVWEGGQGLLLQLRVPLHQGRAVENHITNIVWGEHFGYTQNLSKTIWGGKGGARKVFKHMQGATAKGGESWHCFDFMFDTHMAC